MSATLTKDKELAVMSKVGKLLSELDPEAAERVVRYFMDKHGVWPNERVSPKDRDA